VAARASVRPGATNLVYAVKRLELPAHSARALKGRPSATPPPPAGAATTTRGPRRSTAPTFDREARRTKPAFAMRSQHFTALGDSLVLCRFTSSAASPLRREPYARMVARR